MKGIKKYIIENFSNFTFFYSILRYRLLVVFALAIFGGLLDSLGLTMFLPLLQMADGGTTTDLGSLSFLTDALKAIGIELTVIKALVILVVVFLLKGMVMYFSGIYKVKTQQLLTKTIRMNIINGLTTYSFSRFVQTEQGKIQNIFLGEVLRLSNTYSNYVTMIQGAILIIVYMLFSFIVDWKFALLVCGGGVLSNLVFLKVNKLTKERSINISSVNNAFAGLLMQYVNNFKYLKATGKIYNYRDKLEKSIDDVQHENLKINLLINQIAAFREPLLIIVIALVIGIQVYFIESKISAIIVSLLFFYRALVSIVTVQSSYNLTVTNQGAINNINDFYLELQKNKETPKGIYFRGFKENIFFRNVSFSYDKNKILQDINLNIIKNQTVALVGESGSGKTTFANLLINLLKSDEGEILIDGIDLYSYDPQSFNSKIGYITQEPTIFNDTIYNNITFWDKKNDENLVKFYQVASAASLNSFISSTKDKEDTILGNSGINLSGGQRQRISIARELYKNIDILILDEATSALDSETELEIKNNLDSLHGKVTMLIIAHRLSTIKNADVIYVFKDGKIENFGNFEELKKKSSYFNNLTNLQGI
ncbi:ATP-binding cassette, subfamily B, MsbA [Soonwooa buanensis]|uniref:ATP-binding cassette, subfamily B, MsbA n=1 Tax=Soonwooa buanensis TaxID=619805 RepID=A0A1T5FIJ5_9FLAO|nr:ABC transporter ATP-binding protein [Soonwooa buanensis]SKB95937.1 ATP-binding cassette, subfamily B, MsbA [Soonwooa buanensis]